LRIGSIALTRSTPASIDLRVPPVAWIVRVLKRSLSSR